MDSWHPLYTTGSLVTQDIESKTRKKRLLKKKEKKKIKLLAAKTTTYIEVNTPSTNHI